MTRRAAVRAEDWTAEFALTGLTACLVSPIAWVHHLVWLLPSHAVLRHRTVCCCGCRSVRHPGAVAT